MTTDPFIQVEDPLFGWTREDIVAWGKFRYSKDRFESLNAERLRQLYEAYRFCQIEERDLRRRVKQVISHSDLPPSFCA